MYLLDTNTCIQFLNGKSLPVANRLRAHAPSQLKLCSVVKAEMLYGAARSLHPERTRLLMEGFFSHYESLPFDDAAAASYGSIRHALAVAGTPIGPNDLLIAAIALSRGMILVSHNTREFSRVPDLVVEDWELPPGAPA
jgi:tRNA(fMet)-specific endonuclease VapC